MDEDAIEISMPEKSWEWVENDVFLSVIAGELSVQPERPWSAWMREDEMVEIRDAQGDTFTVIARKILGV